MTSLKKEYEFEVARPIKNDSWTSRGGIKTIETGVYTSNRSVYGPGTRVGVWVGFHTMFSAKKAAREPGFSGWVSGWHYPTHLNLNIEDAERLAAGLMLAIASAREIVP